MEKYTELIQTIEKALNDIKKLQQNQAKQEEFEAYVKAKLEQISKDIATIRRSVVG